METLVRYLDWPERLAEFVESRRRDPFSWGRNDCCTFAAGAVHAMTGVDLSVGYRERVTDAESAARLLEEMGGVEALADRWLERVGVHGVGRGDVVVAPVGRRGRLSFCVVLGELAVGPGDDGIAFVRVSAAEQGWRV